MHHHTHKHFLSQWNNLKHSERTDFVDNNQSILKKNVCVLSLPSWTFRLWASAGCNNATFVPCPARLGVAYWASWKLVEPTNVLAKAKCFTWKLPKQEDNSFPKLTFWGDVTKVTLTHHLLDALLTLMRLLPDLQYEAEGPRVCWDWPCFDPSNGRWING